MSDLWIATLGTTLVHSARIAGAKWAWRLVRLIHAIPYLVGAYLFGVLDFWVWGVEASPHVGGALCTGLVLFLMCCTWVKEWRRGY